jgi:hypothetical protein
MCSHRRSILAATLRHVAPSKALGDSGRRTFGRKATNRFAPLLLGMVKHCERELSC